MRRHLPRLVVLPFVVAVVSAPPSAVAQEPVEAASSTELAHAIDFRTRLGFEASPDVVSRSFADRAAYPDEELGIPLSLAEAAEVARRGKAQLATDAASDWLAQDPRFAGVWMDHTSGTRVLMFAGPVEDVRTGVASRVKEDVAFEVRQARYSWAELEAIQVAIWDARPELDRLGVHVVSTGLDTSTNSIVVGVLDPASGDEDLLRSQFGDVVSVVADRPSVADGCPNDNCWPAKGGIRVTASINASKWCTLGWVARNVDTNTMGFVTAGHCMIQAVSGGVGGGWWHLDGTLRKVIGYNVGYMWFNGADADAGFARFHTQAIPAQRNLFLPHKNAAVRALTSTVSNANQGTDDVVCRTGVTSEYDCGYIVKVNVTRESDVDGVGVRDIEHQNEVAFDSAGGDSGGPVFYGNAAYGTHTHSWDEDETDENPRYSWFSTIDWIKSQYKATHDDTLRICITSSC